MGVNHVKKNKVKAKTSQQTKKPSKDEVKKVRAGITKKVRFEVFKRDSFKCQYCGKSAPDVILHVDHINPVSKGGDNDIMNLITACKDCNQGKKARTLDDKSIIEKQKQQLEELNQRREQLEMMISWRDGLQSFNDDVADIVIEKINELMKPFTVNDNGKRIVSKWIKKFQISEILDAIEFSAEKKINGMAVTSDMADQFFNYIPKIATIKRKPPEEQKLFYVRGILRNRIYVNEKHVMNLIRGWVHFGGDIDELIEVAKNIPNWSSFRMLVASTIEENKKGMEL